MTWTPSGLFYVRDGAGIDERPLETYLGPCQVVLAEGQGRIAWEEMPELLAPRVLFRTGSFPDPDHFNTDFRSLSVELVEQLAARGVVLVGLDTPSVDPFHSKELEAHKAIAREDLAILEGVVLSHVEPGLYELIALPLKLAGADASPVRAVLTRS